LGRGQKLRLLTRSEYENALTDLLGTIATPLDLPADTPLAGFVSIGASEVSVGSPAVSLYEAASRAAVAEVFSDAARWQKLVGCEPKADLSDTCVVSFIESAGKRAYRRALTELEVQRWQHVGREAARLPGASPESGLQAITYGLLQSLNFLYRVETNELDVDSGRLKYDGSSMATRLAFLLTGRPPSDALLSAAAAGELDSVEGVRAAAAPMLNDPSAVERMGQFFIELSQAELVSVVEKNPQLFPSFNPGLKSSMLQASQLFIERRARTCARSSIAIRRSWMRPWLRSTDPLPQLRASCSFSSTHGRVAPVSWVRLRSSLLTRRSNTRRPRVAARSFCRTFFATRRHNLPRGSARRRPRTI
jgi:hypothetical protein